MSGGPFGEPFHGEAIRASGAANTTLLTYKSGDAPGGVIQAFVLAANEYLVITDVLLITAAAGAYALCAATDVAGRRIVRGTSDANGGMAHHFETPYTCPRGVIPVLIADSGAVSCLVQGFVCQD